MSYTLPIRTAIILAALSAATPMLAANRTFINNSHGALWHEPANWIGLVPGIGDTALIGSSNLVENSTVRLDQPAFASQIELTDGMTLRNDSVGGVSISPITVFGNTLVSGVNGTPMGPESSTLHLTRGPGLYDFGGNRLSMQAGGELHLYNDAIVAVSDELVVASVDSAIRGRGVVNLTGGGITFHNSGVVNPTGESLVFNQIGGGLYDLDGSDDAGSLRVDGGVEAIDGLDHLEINGTALSDDFGGEILLRSGRRLDMNLSEGWTLDTNGEINVRPATPSLGSAEITGSDLNMTGALHLEGNSGAWTARLQIDADTTITPTANVQLGRQAELLFNSTTINGGQFTLSEEASLRIVGDTIVAGGEFSTHSTDPTEGIVQFYGQTDYRDDVTFNGIARQVGDATVSQPTVINADHFAMHAHPAHVWTINSGLTINAESISVGDQSFISSTVNVSGNFLSRLSINLTDPTDSWRLSGELNLNNDLHLAVDRLTGSDVELEGHLSVDGPNIGVDASALFASDHTTTFVTAESSLFMRQVTRIEAGASFVGDGLLSNSSTGNMTLEDGVNTDNVGLFNAGFLRIEDRAGIVTVDRFENHTDGTLAIDVGGHLLGDEFDHLQVAGAAELDGTLAVSLLFDDFENPLFLPEIGDEFMILTSLDGVSGQFTDVLPTYAAGNVYGWEVLYHPHDVTIRLASVGAAVPEPASLALFALGGLGFISRRR